MIPIEATDLSNRVHMLVLNHNGRALLEECLPSLLDAARSARHATRITVIDNDSSDGSTGWLELNAPGVGILRMPNHGLASFNEAVRLAPEPIAILLNNDIKLASGAIDHLAAVFQEHPGCFLAGPLCFGFDGRYEGTYSELRFDRGLVHTRYCEWKNPAACERYTASAGAVLAVSRAKFLSLGGFDPLYLPGRYEDLDLAFRGWLAGWEAYFVPRAVAYHKGSATFGRCFARRDIESLDVRNALLFAWKNLRAPSHLCRHAFYLALRIAWATCTGQSHVLRGCARALGRLPAVLRRRLETRFEVRSERDVFQLLRSPAAVSHRPAA